jgi:hypothetical protein
LEYITNEKTEILRDKQWQNTTKFVILTIRTLEEDFVMAVIEELIRTEDDGTISFGNFNLPTKTKKDGFEHDGDLYKIKTFNEITKLERNGLFVYESVPGTAVHNLSVTAQTVSFAVEGPEDAMVTLELEPGTEYGVVIDGADAGVVKTNLGGKLPISVELEDGKTVSVKVDKK